MIIEIDKIKEKHQLQTKDKKVIDWILYKTRAHVSVKGREGNPRPRQPKV